MHSRHIHRRAVLLFTIIHLLLLSGCADESAPPQQAVEDDDNRSTEVVIEPSHNPVTNSLIPLSEESETALSALGLIVAQQLDRATGIGYPDPGLLAANSIRMTNQDFLMAYALSGSSIAMSNRSGEPPREIDSAKYGIKWIEEDKVFYILTFVEWTDEDRDTNRTEIVAELRPTFDDPPENASDPKHWNVVRLDTATRSIESP